MPELLGVTNPTPGLDAVAGNRGLPMDPRDPKIQNVPDPTRVGRPDARTERQDTGAQPQATRYDSNFSAFLQRLREMPDALALLSRLLSGRMGTVVSSGLREGVSEDMARFLDMLPMDQAQLLQFLQQQGRTGSRFSGPFFSLLLGAYRGTESEGMRADLLQFLKRYGDYSSSGHLAANLLRELTQMVRSMPARWARPLSELLAQLQNSLAAGDRPGSLKLLQGQIIPYMSDYVDQTHDLGQARRQLGLLTLDLARYENGSQEGLLQAFHQLKNYAPLRDKLGGLGDEALLRILDGAGFAREAGEDTFAARLAQAAARALRGADGPEAQDAFRALVTSLLVNESVYMTVNHYLIPLDWNGRLMLSELWVDPDADRGEDGARQEGERTLRFLFKLDIQSLGLFDMVLTCRGAGVDVRLHCPQRVAPFSDLVEGALARILAENGFQPGAVQVSGMERPLDLTEVFPKLFEGRDSVHVRI